MNKFFPATSSRSIPFVFKGKFYNYPQETSFSVFIPSLYMYTRSLFSRLFSPPVTLQEWVCAPTPLFQSNEPVVTWIGHATLLIQVGGLNILTDPLFGAPSLLFPRIASPGISLEQLPPIDVILLSHNHYDHMHEPSLRILESRFKPQILVPEKLSAWFYKRGFSRVHELSWWQKRTISIPGNSQDAVTCSFLPARHWSRRGLWDRNTTLWGSWMISYNGSTVYFGGDTAYGPHFKEIHEEFGAISVALLPIAPGEPHALLHHSHMNARQAVQAYKDLGAGELIPIHWGTFYFGIDSFDDPIRLLQRAWGEQLKEVDGRRLRIAKFGEQLAIGRYRGLPAAQQVIKVTQKEI